ncbi:MAG: thiolase family protein [Deltaproteobacteria bacterium]|uniref:Thiolase family protein n=1 Tax=Candidatus Zymogenus saltonus TaxID=2844893 RepID=A0A9D8KB72_9DELT|nr:thiolase family protein [Candidatus Zymogenus saltonus]
MGKKRTAIVATGQTNHRSSRLDVNGIELINEAVDRCLEDGELTIDDIDAVVIGNMDHFEGINYVDMWSIDGTGGFMKPVFKLTTGGTTGSTVGQAGYYLTASGMFDKVLAIGWEKNSESDTTAAITTAFDPIWDRLVFAGAIGGLAVEAMLYLHTYGATQEDAARVAVRDRKHACNNPYAQLRKEITVEDVMNSPMLSDPIKLLDVCPRTDGACAVVYATEEYAEKICPKPAWFHAGAVKHPYNLLGDTDLVGLRSMELAAKEVYQKAGIKEPLKEIDVMELYLPYSYAGLSWIEAMDLCKPGGAPKLIADGKTDMDGELPINPSGGVIATNCIGATALLRMAEAAIQIMGKGGARQVPDVKTAVATGFGGCFWSDMTVLRSTKP